MAKAHHGSPGSRKRRNRARAQGQQPASPAPRPAAPRQPSQPRGVRSTPEGPDSDFRRSLNEASAPILMKLHTLPRWIIPVTMGLLLITGLFLDGAWTWLGALLILTVAAFLGWLLALSWPMLRPGGRLARAFVVAVVIGAAALKVTGNL